MNFFSRKKDKRLDQDGYFTLEGFEDMLNYKQREDGKIISDILNQNVVNFRTCFKRVSIFNDESRGTIKKDKEFILSLMSNNSLQNANLSRVENGSIGSMLGMVIGDAMGARYEFDPVEYNKITLTDMGNSPGGHFRLEPGQWTDDSSMGLCLADSLMVKNGQFDPHDLMLRFISWWEGGYNNAFRYFQYEKGSVGLGGNISSSLQRYFTYTEPYTLSGDCDTSGNGSIMRNGAVPLIYYRDMAKACDVAKRQSRVTHQGTEAYECCAVMTHIIIRILNGEQLHPVLDSLGTTFVSNVRSIQALVNSQQEGNDENRNWNWKAKDFRYSPKRAKRQPGYIGSYCMDNLSMSLHVLYYTNTFKEALIKVVNLRGDSDSVGSVVGQIAGAYYGLKNIPKEWIDTVARWDHYEVALRGYMLPRILTGESSVLKKQ